MGYFTRVPTTNTRVLVKSAVPGVNWVPVQGALVFAPGQLKRTVSIPLIDTGNFKEMPARTYTHVRAHACARAHTHTRTQVTSRRWRSASPSTSAPSLPQGLRLGCAPETKATGIFDNLSTRTNQFTKQLENEFIIRYPGPA